MLDRLRGRKRWEILDEGMQLNAKEIKETFHLFDMNHGGTLHFGDLESRLEDVGVYPTERHFSHMMKLIKKKGHMINFFQYLAIINNLANYLQKIADGKVTKQKIYDILVRFLKRSALSNLSDLRAKAPQVVNPRLPNVLKHYLVGVTLEGLTQKQLIKRVEEMVRMQSPRRATTASLHPRRSLENVTGRGRHASRQIARASSDQICQVKDKDRYLTSLISLTSVRGKSGKETKKGRSRGSSVPRSDNLSTKSPINARKRSGERDTKKQGKKVSKRSSSFSQSYKSKDRGSNLKPRKSMSCDQGKKTRHSARTANVSTERRMHTAPPSNSLAGMTEFSSIRITSAGNRRSSAIASRGEILARPKYSTASSSGHASAKSSLRFLDSQLALLGTSGKHNGLMRRYIQSSLPHESRMEKALSEHLKAIKSATVQVGGPHGDQPRRSMYSQHSKSSDRKRSIVSKTPTFPGLPYITPYFFPKMTYFDLPCIRNEMALRRSICSEVLYRHFEEKWRKRSLVRAYNNISSPSLQRRFERAVQAYGYKLK